MVSPSMSVCLSIRSSSIRPSVSPFLCPGHFQCGGGGVYIVSMSIRTSVCLSRTYTNGFCAISFERIVVLD